MKSQFIKKMDITPEFEAAYFNAAFEKMEKQKKARLSRKRTAKKAKA